MYKEFFRLVFQYCVVVAAIVFHLASPKFDNFTLTRGLDIVCLYNESLHSLHYLHNALLLARETAL